MVRHTLKILQQMLQAFKMPDHFGTLCIKGLTEFENKWYYFIKQT